MSALQITEPVGDIVARRPALSRVFEQAGIDYCCGGAKTLGEACREKGVDPQEFADRLEEAKSSGDEEDVVDAASMPLTELADHIERTHHTYLRSELSRLEALTKKVASVHGDRNSRLRQISATFIALASELSSHMVKEEQILFPLVRQLDASEIVPAFHCGSIADPIHQMECEHDLAGSALRRLSDLTDGYTSPEWACNTYRAMLDALAYLERDLHLHIHKENNVLFPRALEMEKEKQP